jgi:hypothetical protein
VFANPASGSLDILGKDAIYFTDDDIGKKVERTVDDPYDPSLNKTPYEVTQFKRAIPNAVIFAIILLVTPFILYSLWEIGRKLNKLSYWIYVKLYEWNIMNVIVNTLRGLSQIFYYLFTFAPHIYPQDREMITKQVLAKYNISNLSEQLQDNLQTIKRYTVLLRGVDT